MSETGPPLALSIVVPVYNEEGNVEPLHGELTQVARQLGRPYELVFVNDGSRDGTLARLMALRARDESLRIVELDVVSGRRRERQEAFLTRVLPSRIANWLVARATGVPVHDTGCGLKVYRREVVAGAQLPRGMNRFLPAVLGVRPTRVAEEWVNDRRRGSGRSHYGLSRAFAVLRDLPALPVLVRLPRRGLAFGRALGAAPVALVGGLLLAILAGLGWPAGLVPALLAWFATLLAAAVGAAIAHDVGRWARAREHGVFRVRRTF